MNRWKQLKGRFVIWQDFGNARIETRILSDRTLRDIGLRRGNERCYVASPF